MGVWCSSPAPHFAPDLKALVRLEDWQSLQYPESHDPVTLPRNHLLAQVIAVQDGGTLIVSPAVAGKRRKPVTVQLTNVDPPDLHSQTIGEQQHARRCQQILQRLLLNKIVLVHIIRQVRWGIWEAEVLSYWLQHPRTCTSIVPLQGQTRQPGVAIDMSLWMVSNTACLPKDALHPDRHANTFATMPLDESYSKVAELSVH